MKKKTIGILVLTILMLVVAVTSSFGYSDEIFECDLPSNYANMKYQNISIFTDSAIKHRGFMIYTEENIKIKKSVWDISQSDIDELVSSLSGKASEVIETDKRAKLGKEKAVKLIISEDGQYMEMYLLASNKYIYGVIFLGDSQEDLESEDYTMIKNSFKLKDSTTNFKLIYVLLIIMAGAIGIFVRLKRVGRIGGNIGSFVNRNNYKNTIDYKNLTEDDFKKM